MSNFDKVQQRVQKEYAEYMTGVCDNVAAVTGKGIIHAIENSVETMNGDIRTKYDNCKKDLEENFGKNPDPHIEVIFARMYGLI